jgi:NADPH:quinone reductase-like Zn-dependent oxidoreductase
MPKGHDVETQRLRERALYLCINAAAMDALRSNASTPILTRGTCVKAARIHRFGPPQVIVLDDLRLPMPNPDQVLIRVAAAGVSPWDALIRERKSVVNTPLPLTLGSDLTGIVELVGADVHRFKQGDKVCGATNPEFIGAYAEYALASATMIARKPDSLCFDEAASAPVVAVTAWQMRFDFAKAMAGQSVLVQGAGGNVGAYGVQLARQAGLRVFAAVSSDDVSFVESLGVETGIDYETTRFEDAVPPADIVLDLVGGDTRKRSVAIIKPGGILVSVVSEPLHEDNATNGVRVVFFLVKSLRND